MEKIVTGFMQFDVDKNLDVMIPFFEQAYNSVVITTAQLELPGPNIIYANEAFCKQTGYTKEEILGQTPRILQGEKSDRAVLDRLKERLQRDDFFQGTTVNYRKDGSQYWVEWNISSIYNSEGKKTHYFCVQHDVTAFKEIEFYKNHLQELVDEKTQEVIRLNREIEETLKETLFQLGEIAEGKSKETGLHVKRVSQYSALLGELYGLPDEEIEILRLSSALHDLGKINIPEEILHKPAALTSDEYAIMKTHPQIGYEMLKASNRKLFKTASAIALTHHEWFDGSGYPHGVKGEDIDLFGRIVGLADVFDALSTRRCYKKPWSDEEVKKYINDVSGRQFDPRLAELFLENYEKFVELREKSRD